MTDLQTGLPQSECQAVVDHKQKMTKSIKIIFDLNEGKINLNYNRQNSTRTKTKKNADEGEQEMIDILFN